MAIGGYTQKCAPAHEFLAYLRLGCRTWFRVKGLGSRASGLGVSVWVQGV